MKKEDRRKRVEKERESVCEELEEKKRVVREKEKEKKRIGDK